MPKKKAKDRQGVGKKTEGTISRRNVLKIGAAAGAAGVLAPGMLTSKEALGFQTIAEPVICVTPPTSPPHHPFVDEFLAPFPALDRPLNPQPTEFPNLGAGEADRAPHQRWAEFTPAKFTYELDARPGLHTFHSDFSPTYVWGFNGKYPAPTLLQRYGKSTIVRFRNSLPGPPPRLAGMRSRSTCTTGTTVRRAMVLRATSSEPASGKTIFTQTSTPASMLLAASVIPGKRWALSGSTTTAQSSRSTTTIWG